MHLSDLTEWSGIPSPVTPDFGGNIGPDDFRSESPMEGKGMKQMATKIMHVDKHFHKVEGNSEPAEVQHTERGRDGRSQRGGRGRGRRGTRDNQRDVGQRDVGTEQSDGGFDLPGTGYPYTM